MNTYTPLELTNIEGKGNGIFHMTCTNDDRTWPVGYCQINKNSETQCRHKTPEEASDCYRDYCIHEKGGMMAGFEMKDDDNKRGTVIMIRSSY